jgi:hypothetical protein
MLKVQMKGLALASMLLGLGACVSGTPIVTASGVECLNVIPSEWEKGVPGAPLPTGDTVGDWVAFGDAQTGRLDQANQRVRDIYSICRNVKRENDRAEKRGSRGFFGRLFG